MIESNRELSADALLDALAMADAAMAVYTSEDLYIRFANNAMLRLWGKERDIIGNTLSHGVPELNSQPFIGLLQNVWRTGKTYIGTEIPGLLKIDDALTTAYFDFEYKAVLNSRGKTYCIIHTAADVTARVTYKRLAKEKEGRELQLNEELSAANEELHTANEEQGVINEELQSLNEELTVSGEELQFLNDERRALNEELTGKNEELKSLNQEYLALNDKVVLALETANLAKTAANLGTFDLDIINDKLDWDARCKELFGISPAVEVTYSADFVKGLHHEDKKGVLQAVANAYDFDLTGGNYDIQFRTIGAEDNQLRWVKAIGKVLFNPAKQPVRFIGSVMDITEQKEDEQRKSDFIGMVSHELKTPITSLSAYLQLLQVKANKAGDAFTINALDKSSAQVKKMVSMINGFLNMSHLESGKIHIDKQPFDLVELLREIAEESHAVIGSHKLVFVPCQSTMITADRDKIAQVINNFISNAVKYSPKDTTITITCETVAGTVVISVKDQGMGIEPQNISKLFDRYYRVQGKQTKSISGFGLGLYLGSEIIKRHGGEIGAESEMGKGSVFWFKLPLYLA